MEHGHVAPFPKFAVGCSISPARVISEPKRHRARLYSAQVGVVLLASAMRFDPSGVKVVCGDVSRRARFADLQEGTRGAK